MRYLVGICAVLIDSMSLDQSVLRIQSTFYELCVIFTIFLRFSFKSSGSNTLCAPHLVLTSGFFHGNFIVRNTHTYVRDGCLMMKWRCRTIKKSPCSIDDCLQHIKTKVDKRTQKGERWKVIERETASVCLCTLNVVLMIAVQLAFII